MDIPRVRLANHHLIGEKFSAPADVVKWLGAVQSQDFSAAKWALGLRMKSATDEVIEKAFDNGDILRTHIMRPTWHFVLPSDILWMQELTSGNVKKLMGHYNRKLELDEEVFKKSNALIVKVLKNKNYLTRQELKRVLEDIGIKTDVQRLAHIVSWAELDGLICSGPKKGKQQTYALLEKRVPKVKKLSRDEALSTLALRYFTSHGPAQLKDFSWWSGLSIKESTEALGMLASKLSKNVSGGKEYWFVNNSFKASHLSPVAFLLSIYDEYTIAYKDRSDISQNERDIEKLISMGNALTAVIILDGKVIGTWKRILKKQRVEVKLNLFRNHSANEEKALQSAVESYGTYLGLNAVLV